MAPLEYFTTCGSLKQHGPVSEETLYVRRLQEKDPAAYERLMDRYHASLLRMASRMIGDTSEAADLVQDIFFKVFRNIGTFRGDAALKSWIFRIALSEILNRRRWWSRRRRFAMVSLEEARMCDPSAAPDRLLELKELGSAIDSAFDEISAEHRLILMLREIDGLTYGEIAVASGIASGTVKSRLARARNAMRRALLRRAPIHESWPL